MVQGIGDWIHEINVYLLAHELFVFSVVFRVGLVSLGQLRKKGPFYSMFVLVRRVYHVLNIESL